MQALWHLDNMRSEVRTTSPEHRHPQFIHVKSLYSLISLGTELTVAKGLVPEDLHTEMRVPYMEGEFHLPVKYGYSLVGQIAKSGAIGHVMHPHQSECLINPDAFYEIPADIPPKRATLASNLETALTGIWDGEVKPGERVAVVGFGLVGSLVARIASGIPGTTVRIVETHAERIRIAHDLGFMVEQDLNKTSPFDIAFHSSGTQTGLQTAIQLTGLEGRIIEMSWYGNHQVTLALGTDFHIMRKRLISSQVSHVPGSMQNMWDPRRRKEVVFQILKDPAYDAHITHEVSLEEAAALFNQWRSSPPSGLSYCIKY